MAITVAITARTAAVAAAAEVRFTTSGPFVLYGDGFAYQEGVPRTHPQERCLLQRLGPSGEYIQATNKDGPIFVGAAPNMVYVDAAGSYQLVKDLTVAEASVGYEEQ